MRLICPNCDAQYEVEASLIPEDGRDVQCSACGEVWFHGPEDMTDEDLPRPVSTSEPTEPEDDTHTIRRPVLDEAMLSVLREEVERETRARAAETARATPRTLETQPDLGLPDAAPRLRIRPREDQTPVDADEVTEASIRPSRRDLLPDIEEINSTLDATSANRGTDADVRVPAPAERQRAGFRSGFLMMLALAVIAVSVYSQAPRLVRSLPASEPVVTGYVEAVNTARRGLDQAIGGLLTRLRG